MTSNHLWFLIPEAILLVGVVFTAITGLVRSTSIRQSTPVIAAIFVVASGVASVFVFSPDHLDTTAFLMPALGRWVGVITAAVGLVLILNSIGRVDRRLEQAIAAGRLRFDPLRAGRGEYYAFMLLSLAGLMLVCTANDLIWLFLALELTSLPTYVLVAMSRTNRLAQEAAMKYFFLGAMSAAIFLYGFALLYAATGTIEFDRMRYELQSQAANGGLGALAIGGLLLSLFGIGYKLAAAPLHLYAADVYEGASAPVTAFLGFVPKAAGVLAIMVLLVATGLSELMSSLPYPILIMLWVVAVLTMTLGNIGALLQRSVKRMLAYSSIAHSGYLLIGIIAGPGLGYTAVLFYLLAYGVGNTAAFSVLSSLERRGEELTSLEDLAGLRQRHPLMASVLAISSGSLLGFPPLLGFWGKLLLFIAGIQTGHLVLVIIAAVNSAISGWYYLKLVAVPIMASPTARSESVERGPSNWPRFAGVIMVIACLVLPVFLGWLVAESRDSARTAQAVRADSAQAEADAVQPSDDSGLFTALPPLKTALQSPAKR
ncbi:MAG: NADH-quinone oxidoreductase subunit N [Phycisphaerales bacterium]|nr:NADH-quinone oxidoreductase subunit N [Phycisphaerales bacterium]